jgi:hypothetical protein
VEQQRVKVALLQMIKPSVFSVFFQTNIILRGMVAVKARAYGQKKKPSREGFSISIS